VNSLLQRLLPFLYPLAIAAPLLVAGNCQAPAAAGPAVTRYGVLDGKEPTVRVWLRSLGTPEELVVDGRQGLVVESGGRARHVESLALAGSGKRLAVPGAGGAVVVRAPDGIVRVGEQTYSGELLVEDGRLLNRVPLENYVLGVLRGELPLGNVPEEAATAQAMAVRSYTLHYLLQRRNAYDVDDTTLFQRYVGLRYAPDDDALRAGVRRSIGLYLSHEGEPLKAYYHSTCGGSTAAVRTGLNRDGPAPLRSVSCEACTKSKYYRWRASIPNGAWLKAAGLEGRLRAVKIARSDGARAARITLSADSGRRSLHAGELRLRLGGSRLRSTRIEKLERAGDTWVVEGGGWGHGVGLCQMGAIGYAARGRDARWIVGHYYPGATVRRAY